jgi:hypothetical protein
MATMTRNMNSSLDDDLERYTAAVDDLVDTLRGCAKLGTVLTISEIIVELMPPCGRRATKRHCRMLATSLAILLQRGTLTS